MMRIGKILLGLWFIGGLGSAAWAGPPFETDDPELVDLGHWEVYAAASYFGNGSGATGTAPQVEVNYGAFPDIQLHVIAPFAFNAPKIGSSFYGYGDTELGIKFRLVSDWDSNFQMATFPLVELPTGNKTQGLGSGQTQAFIPLWFQKQLGPFTSYGGGGYWINPGTGNRDWVYLGWAVEDQLDALLTLGGELFFHTSPVVGGTNVTGWNGGGRLNLDSGNHLMLSLGRDFTQGSITFRGYAAYQWTF